MVLPARWAPAVPPMHREALEVKGVERSGPAVSRAPAPRSRWPARGGSHPLGLAGEGTVAVFQDVAGMNQ